MSLPSSSTVGNSPIFTAPARSSGLYSSPLHLDTDRHCESRGSIGASSPWRTTGEPGSPADDSRSVASSVRSARRRRGGGGGPESATFTCEGKEWTQAFMDLERMQRENKERMQGSVRSGRSSPGEDLFFRSGSTSSCRSSVRRRRWHVATGTNSNNNGQNGMDGTATSVVEIGEESVLGSVSIKSPIPNVELTVPHGSSVAAPQLIAMTGTETAVAAATEPGNAAPAEFPFGNLSFSPTEGKDPEARAEAKPRLSGLPMWLKRRPTANTPNKMTQTPAVHEAAATNMTKVVDNEEAELVTASAERAEPATAPFSNKHCTSQLYAVEQNEFTNAQAQSANETESPQKSSKAPHYSPASPVSRAGGVSPTTTESPTQQPQPQQGGQVRRSPLPGPGAHEITAGASSTSLSSHSTRAATANSTRRHSNVSASASPLMQTYLARHIRAAAAALAAAGSSNNTKITANAIATVESLSSPTPTKPELSNAAAEVEASPVRTVEDLDTPASGAKAKSGHSAKDEAQLPGLRSPLPANASEREEMHGEEKGLNVSVNHGQLPATLVVDKDNGDETVDVMDVKGGLCPLQTFHTAFAAAKEAHLPAENTATAVIVPKNSVDTSDSTLGEVKVHRPARLVRQDLAVKKPAVGGATGTTASAKQRAVSSRLSAAADASQLHSVSRDRPSASVARARPSASIGREYRDPSHVRSEPSVPRSSRQRSSVNTSHPETAESFAARTSRERSTAPEKTHDAPSGHLQRSTTLFEMRRQQVLLDRQERERKAAAEERARLGMVTQTLTVKKKLLPITSGAVEERDRCAGVSATLAKEKAVKAMAQSEEGHPTRPIHRLVSAAPVGTSTTAIISSASTADSRSQLATAATSPHERRRPEAGGMTNASTMTKVASPTMASTLAPVASATAPTALMLNGPPATEALNVVAAAPLSSSSPTLRATAVASAAHHQALTTADGAAAAPPTTLSRARKPIINTSSLSHNHVAASPPPSASVNCVAHPAATASTPVASNSGVRGRAETRIGAAEVPAPVSRHGKVVLNPVVTLVTQHRIGVSTRRVRTKQATLSTTRSPNAEAVTVTTNEKATKLNNVSKESTLKSPLPTTPGSQDVASATVVAAVPAAVEAAVSKSVVIPVSATSPPVSAESRPAPFCVECGQRHVDDAAKFCAVCGHRRTYL